MSSNDQHSDSLLYGDQHDQEVLETFEGRPGYVQESLFDIGPDEELGYRVPIACQVAGITYRQLDYWAVSYTHLTLPTKA